MIYCEITDCQIAYDMQTVINKVRGTFEVIFIDKEIKNGIIICI